MLFLDFHHQSRLSELSLSSLGSLFRPGELGGERVFFAGRSFLPRPASPPKSRCASPLDYVARVQAFLAQQRAFVAVAGATVILVEDRQLVIGGEASPPGSIWHRGFVAHWLIMARLIVQGGEGHFRKRSDLALQGWTISCGCLSSA